MTFAGYRVIHVAEGDEAAANTICFNDLLLMPARFPRTAETLHAASYDLREIGNSECARLDGGAPQGNSFRNFPFPKWRHGYTARKYRPGRMSMTARKASGQTFNIVTIAQAGRLQVEALLFAASLRATNPGFSGRLFAAEPLPGPLWSGDPRITDAQTRDMLESLGATFLPFESRHFGGAYPYGNKIEALTALPQGEPFVFFDTDTLITGDLGSVAFDFNRPSASMRREGTWPTIELYGPGYGEIWKSLYDRFGLDYESSLDLSQPNEYWQRYLYFNAGWFFHRCPHEFGARFLDYALSIRDDPPEALVCQPLDPWLDQVALPLVIRSFGGGRPGPGLAGLDGAVSCHYRWLPLLYAQESDRAVAVLEDIATPKPMKQLLRASEAMRKLVFQDKGAKVRAMFDRANLPLREQAIRNTIKRKNLWLR